LEEDNTGGFDVKAYQLAYYDIDEWEVVGVFLKEKQANDLRDFLNPDRYFSERLSVYEIEIVENLNVKNLYKYKQLIAFVEKTVDISRLDFYVLSDLANNFQEEKGDFTFRKIPTRWFNLRKSYRMDKDQSMESYLRTNKARIVAEFEEELKKYQAEKNISKTFSEWRK